MHPHTEIDVKGKPFEFFLVAGNGFNFKEYKQYLTELANEAWHRPEPTYLNETILTRRGEKNGSSSIYKNICVWFDFMENDILFTLSQKESDALVKILSGIEERWGRP